MRGIFIKTFVATYVLLAGLLNYVQNIRHVLDLETLGWKQRVFVPVLMPFELPQILVIEFLLFGVIYMLFLGEYMRKMKKREEAKKSPATS